jgi:hypothetical protein
VAPSHGENRGEDRRPFADGVLDFNARSADVGYALSSILVQASTEQSADCRR